MSSRLKLLVIAEAANPEWVSVPLVGWSFCKALRQVADVHIVTQVRNRDAFLRAGLLENVDFTAIDSEAVARPLWKIGSLLRMGEGKGWTTLQAFAALSYPYFEHLVWQSFGKDIKAGRYDVVHRVTPLSPTIPSPLARRCAQAGTPFVLGPLNGGVPWPKGFNSERRREREVLSYVRNLYKLAPGRSSTLANSAAIIVGSRHTESEIPLRFREKCVYLPENAIDANWASLPKPPLSVPLRGCFIGRMVPYKGPDILLEAAMPLLLAGRLRLDMIGDGPLLSGLKNLVIRNGASDAVTFHGWMAHADVRTVASQCTLFAFPSIREFGGGAVMEAMALGLAPLIVDYAGPGEIVTDETGIKVPIGTRREIVERFRSELERLAENPDLASTIGLNARDRVRSHFTWDRKARQILQVYDWVLGRSTKPDDLLPAMQHATD